MARKMVIFKTAFIFLLGLSRCTLAAPTPVSPGDIVNFALDYPTNAPNRYSGPWQAFPNMDTWNDFNTMFEKYRGYMESTGSSPSDVQKMRTGIENAASGHGVDGRVILGIIIEESSGNVAVATTWNVDGVPTAGLMQAQGCPGFPGQANLSQDQINSMIWCGTAHYKFNLRNHGDQNAPVSLLPALREYNTGSVPNHENLSDGRGFSNEWYVSDIVQRMQGHVF